MSRTTRRARSEWSAQTATGTHTACRRATEGRAAADPATGRRLGELSEEPTGVRFGFPAPV